jgi:hypothetical protein
MSDLKQMSALTSLNSMMHKGYFDICTVDSVGELLGIKPREADAYLILRPLHCIHFNRMPQELRDAIPSLIQECLGVAPVFQFRTLDPLVIEIREPVEAPTPKRSGFLRLLGGGK